MPIQVDPNSNRPTISAATAMSAVHPAIARAEAFAASLGLELPLLLAPMAGACPPGLSIAVAKAGGLGACGALLLTPQAIWAWAEAFRAGCTGDFQINLWIPGPPPQRDVAREAAVRGFLSDWGPAVGPEAGDAPLIDFEVQCEALLEVAPAVASSIMGLYPPRLVERMKARRIKWLANVTTVAEAKAAQDAGADFIVVQGMEAGGHRGTFDAPAAESSMVGLFALLPAVVDAVKLPVIASGAIADARGVAAALILGASAVQVGTAFLRTPEADLPRAWADGLAGRRPEETRVTRAFSGRAGRSLATAYVRAAAGPEAPAPAPYPVQRGLTQAMRQAGVEAGDLDRIQAWAGQAAGRAQALAAPQIAQALWLGARRMLGAAPAGELA